MINWSTVGVSESTVMGYLFLAWCLFMFIKLVLWYIDFCWASFFVLLSGSMLVRLVLLPLAAVVYLTQLVVAIIAPLDRSSEWADLDGFWSRYFAVFRVS